jgi:hypothetical protein
LTVLLLGAGADSGAKVLARERPVVQPAKAGPAEAGDDIEELQVNTYARDVRVVSPAQGMTFSAGIPLRVFGSCMDGVGWKAKVECFLDGKSFGVVAGKREAFDYYEFFLNGVPAGRHVLVLKARYINGGTSESVPLTVMVEASSPRVRTVKLTEDLVLRRGQDLRWENATILGNSFRVRSEPGWAGRVSVRNCRISGLGSVAAAATEIKTAGGSIVVEDSVFEGGGTVRLAAEGGGDFIVRNNEFRANNVIKFWSSEPGLSPMVVLSGNPSGKKLFQGNRVGIGWVAFEGGAGWLIGGDDDASVNVLLGQRGGIRLSVCRDCALRGNYSVPKLGGGWSQGTNFFFDRCSGILCEHNVIGATSWPVQSFGGEFRYNAVVGSGHEWMRTVMTGTRIHHNLFLNGCGQWSDGILIYDGRKDVAVYNNTFDGGAARLKPVPIVTSPVLRAEKGNSFSGVRNNIFMGNVPWPSGATPPIVVGGPGCVGRADYNCFFNPEAPKLDSYAEGVVAGKPGAHDVHADPRLGVEVPSPIKPGRVWDGTAKLSQVLAYYRARYAPAPGSPVLGAGDSADGKDSYMGAVGAGNDPDDRFGRFATPTKKRTKK